MGEAGLLDNPIEGDYVETVDGLFFSVKGVNHPAEGVLGILRYVPDPEGERERGGVRYTRVFDLDAIRSLIEEKYTEYLGYVPELSLVTQVIPLNRVKKHYSARQRLKEITREPKDELETSTARLVQELSRESGVPLDHFGVTGSLLIGTHRAESDIDFTVFGKAEGRQVYDALKRLREEGGLFRRYDDQIIQQKLKSRWGSTGLPVERFREVEERKVIYGFFDGVFYYVRLVRPIPEDSYSKPLGRVRIHAEVLDDSEAIYSPCIYGVRTIRTLEGPSRDVTEVLSFRGKFSDRAVAGETVEAYGMLEEVVRGGVVFYRLVLGGGAAGDYLVQLGL